jgi:hypothetical protein
MYPKTKNPVWLETGFSKERRHLSLRGGSPVGFRYKTKKLQLLQVGVS